MRGPLMRTRSEGLASISELRWFSRTEKIGCAWEDAGGRRCNIEECFGSPIKMHDTDWPVTDPLDETWSRDATELRSCTGHTPSIVTHQLRIGRWMARFGLCPDLECLGHSKCKTHVIPMHMLPSISSCGRCSGRLHVCGSKPYYY